MTRPVKDIDTRHLCIANGFGAPSCGLVGIELARMIHKYKHGHRFFDAACLNVIRREFGIEGCHHPVVAGALLERAIMCAMAERPLAVPLGNMTRLCPTVIELENGAEQAAVEELHMEFLKGGKEESLFMVVPMSTAYKAVDAVLLGFRRESKGCHMYIGGVQITVGKLPKHRLNRKVFMRKACMKFVPVALSMDEDVSWSMNWIVPDVEMADCAGHHILDKDSGFEVRSRSSISKGKAGGNQEVECLEVYTTFRQIDPRLAFLDAFKLN